eukprot:TRINITY_DN11707_c1_g1_i1.p1 TRINITY_DN11707_c1_g1~~TRINITY_DN11707_c1_g1_i1.p1  ORF type:complete len:585 (+),score=161.14 TRINITY_DN11707_c1_g1_i1:130-1755(+)
MSGCGCDDVPPLLSFPQPVPLHWREAHHKSEVNPATGARNVAGRWDNEVRRDAVLPRPRSGHTIVVHEREGVAIMFGGLGDDSDGCHPVNVKDPVLNDLWKYDLRTDTWTEIHATGTYPEPVFGHTAEIIDTDPENLCLLVFGGQSSGGALANETYILSNVLRDPQWHKLSSTRSGSIVSSLARWGHTMVTLYEPPNTRSIITQAPVSQDGNLLLIVFGGMAASYESLGDVWVFDVSRMQWSELQVKSARRPTGRRRHVAAIDGHKMWVFGGRSEWNYFHKDLWCLDLDTLKWSEIATPCSPLPRTGHCGAMHGHHLYIFGGFELRGMDEEWDYVLHNDLHRFNTKTHRWEEVRPGIAGGGDDVERDGDGDGSKPKGLRLGLRGLLSRTPRAWRGKGAAAAEAASDSCCAGAHAEHETTHTCPDLVHPCHEPRKRSMAACYVYRDRLFIHGGRDKYLAFHCAFSVALPAPPSRHLVPLLAQYIVTNGIEYRARVPPELSAYLDSVLAPRPLLQVRSAPPLENDMTVEDHRDSGEDEDEDAA